MSPKNYAVSITFPSASQASRALGRIRKHAFFGRGIWRHVRRVEGGKKSVRLLVIDEESVLTLARRLPVLAGAPGRVSVEV